MTNKSNEANPLPCFDNRLGEESQSSVHFLPHLSSIALKIKGKAAPLCPHTHREKHRVGERESTISVTNHKLLFFLFAVFDFVFMIAVLNVLSVASRAAAAGSDAIHYIAHHENVLKDIGCLQAAVFCVTDRLLRFSANNFLLMVELSSLGIGGYFALHRAAATPCTTAKPPPHVKIGPPNKFAPEPSLREQPTRRMNIVLSSVHVVGAAALVGMALICISALQHQKKALTQELVRLNREMANANLADAMLFVRAVASRCSSTITNSSVLLGTDKP